METLKQKLYQACVEQLTFRLETISHAIKAIQQSANEETKSTAGDKYETGRAMAQLEIEKYTFQLADVKKMQQDLARINPLDSNDIVKPGSLVFTTRGNFYISINAGEHNIDQKSFVAISAAAPIAQKLIGLRAKSLFSFNNSEFTILEIL